VSPDQGVRRSWKRRSTFSRQAQGLDPGFRESLRTLWWSGARSSIDGRMPSPATRPTSRHEYATGRRPVSRLVLAAQEDAREIARAIRRPGQSLPNIVLQAQIVERLVDPRPSPGQDGSRTTRRDGSAHSRCHQDVHLRRPTDGPRRPRAGADPCGEWLATAAGARRSRSSSSRTAPDSPPAMDVESALFRLIDETVTGFLSCSSGPHLDPLRWATGRTEARISARREEIDREPGRRRVDSDRQARQGA